MSLGLLNEDSVLSGDFLLDVRDNRRKGLILGGIEGDF